MAVILNGVTIKAPQSMTEENDTQTVQNRVLTGSRTRDQFGSNKRVWILEYQNIQKADYDTINTQYQAYLSTGTVVTFESTETNYTVASTSVHVDLLERSFDVGGSGYLSSFKLTLTEA